MDEATCSRPLPGDCLLTVGNRMLAHLVRRWERQKDLTLCFLCSDHSGSTEALISDMSTKLRRRQVAYSIRGGGALVLATVDWQRLRRSEIADALLLLALDHIREEGKIPIEA